MTHEEELNKAAEEYTHVGATNDIKELGNGPWDKGYQPSGISKAEEAARKAYPYDGGTKGWICKSSRPIFIKGYESAEKDLALTWEDMKAIICIDEEMMDDPESHPEWMEEQPFYEEMLRRFNERKK